MGRFSVIVTYDAVTRYSAAVKVYAANAREAKERVEKLSRESLTSLAYTALTSYSLPPEIEEVMPWQTSAR